MNDHRNELGKETNAIKCNFFFTSPTSNQLNNGGHLLICRVVNLFFFPHHYVLNTHLINILYTTGYFDNKYENNNSECQSYFLGSCTLIHKITVLINTKRS